MGLPGHEADRRHHVGGVHLGTELGRLLEHRGPGVVVLHADVDRLKAGAGLLDVARLALAARVGHGDRRAERRMPGERDLAGDREDPVAVVGASSSDAVCTKVVSESRVSRANAAIALVVEIVGVVHHGELVARSA